MEFAPMEEMHGLHLARASPIEEERSACGGEARSTSSPASRMENYAEIFGGFAASCSIPVLVLPEAMNGYEEELAGSHNSCLNYLEIFGVLDAGTFSLSYEELFSNEKGSSKKDEEDDRFLDDTDAVQVEAGPPELLVGGHITFSKGNQISSSFHLKFDAAETASPTGFVEVDSHTNAASDDHIRSGYVTEEKVAGKQKETLNRCFVGAIVDGSENDLNNADEPPSTNAAYDLKQRSHSSTHHLTSSADIPLSDYAFFTISNINLCTQPLEVPAPLRAPPKFKMKTLEAPNVTFNRNYQAHHQAGGPHTRNALKETAKSTPIFCDMEVDASKAAAAMVEAMEQAQASLRSAKEFMERIDKQFYDEPFDSDGDIKLEHQIDAHQYFSENDSCGSHGQRSLHGVDDNGDENKALTINAFKINENKMFSGVELQMQDGNAKKSKSGIINDKDEVMSIFGEHQVEETHRHASDMEDISETTVAFDYGEFKSNVGMAHSSKADNRNVTSEFGTYGSYNEENSSFTGLDKTNGPVKKQRAKWNLPNISELNVAELFGQPVCLEKAEEALEFQQKEALEFQQNEEKIVFERPHKFESYEGGLNADGEQKKDEKKILRKVQAALELEKKIMGLSATQQVSAHHVFERERNKEAERKRKLEKERAREREKDAISVASPATAEAGECAIGRVLAEQSSLGATKQTETSCIVSNDKDWQYDEAEGIARAGDEDKDNDSKPCSDVHDTSNDMMSQSEVLEGESPLRCKARQERCQRIVERAAKALAEKNMRDLLAQREQAERNRLAESLDVEIRRWSSGKEGNLRALLSTLQYILGHDSGWQPIPLTEVITAAAVRKAYRKATLYVHPDKLQQRGATIQHKYICEKVFDLLKDAWSKFNSEGR